MKSYCTHLHVRFFSQKEKNEREANVFELVTEEVVCEFGDVAKPEDRRTASL